MKEIDERFVKLLKELKEYGFNVELKLTTNKPIQHTNTNVLLNHHCKQIIEDSDNDIYYNRFDDQVVGAIEIRKKLNYTFKL